MPVPSILLALLIASLIGSVFHIFRGGGRSKLLEYIGLSCTGFFIGHFVALWRDLLLFRVGALEVGAASIASLAFLFGSIAYVRINLYLKDGRV